MYRAIVRVMLRRAFDALNRGEYTAVFDKFAPNAEHCFIGDHALGGRRLCRASIEAWYKRLFTVFPDIRFDLHCIRVSGPPWRTTAIIEWTETNTGTDGVPSENEGVNVFEMRWGKVRRLRIYTDTYRLQRVLDRLSRAGSVEAGAPPIVDDERAVAMRSLAAPAS